MQPRALKYVLDIESLVQEIESFKQLVGNDFFKYQKELVVKRAVERDLEIIGEAVKELVRLEPNLKISSSRKIISFRNLLAHSYDSVEDELVWGILQKDIPTLRLEIEAILKAWDFQSLNPQHGDFFITPFKVADPPPHEATFL